MVFKPDKYWTIGASVLPVTVVSEDVERGRCQVRTETDEATYTARTAQLHPWFPADEITVKCGCGDEYVLMVPKINEQSMLRGKGCNCSVDVGAEAAAITRFYNPKGQHWSPQFDDDADERVIAKGDD